MSESRRVILDKARAISTAKHPKDSCLGRALLRNNVFEGRILSGELGKINHQSKRQQMHLDQEKKRFLRTHVLPEPSIIVERPPSPEIMRRALFPEYYDDDAYYFDPAMPPHYMKPLENNNKPPSTLVTMDLFRVQPRKKVNVWEEAMLEKEKPHFHSTVRPATRLTAAEQEDLRKTWSLHKRNKSATDATRPSTSLVPSKENKKLSIGMGSAMTQHSRRPKSSLGTEHYIKPHKLSASNRAEGTFITELPDFRNDSDDELNKEGKVGFIETDTNNDDVIKNENTKLQAQKRKRTKKSKTKKKTSTKLFEILMN